MRWQLDRRLHPAQHRSAVHDDVIYDLHGDTMKPALKRTGQLLGVGALAGLGYLGTTWARYGNPSRRGPKDLRLDQFMPVYEVREVHHTRVAAPALVTFAVAQEVDMQQSPLLKAIFLGRELVMGAARVPRAPQSIRSEVLALGWRVLFEEPGHLVMGAVTQPWKADVKFRGIPPEEFAGFREPGYAKIAWTLVAEPLTPTACVFRTETRVTTTDAEARKRFRRYWCLVSPGVLLIRREMLRLVRRDAERRARSYGDSVEPINGLISVNRE
jgi:hypothetical protein